MSREIEYDKDANCDICGALGAYDFMGDYVCQDCYTEVKYADQESNIEE